MARIVLIFSFLSLVFFISYQSQANSCCGQSPASFTILSLGQSLNANLSYSAIQTQGRMEGSQGEFVLWDDKQRQVQAWTLNVASQVLDRHQVFINGALLEGRFKDDLGGDRSSDWSDVQLGYTYELVSEYRFSYWRPLIYVTALVNLPTGFSIYDDANQNEGFRVTGHNQWGAGLGVTLRKVYFPVTLTLQGRSLHIFSKTFSETQVSNFYDSSLAFLVNYASSLWGLQFNGGLTFNHLSQRKLMTVDVTSEVSQNFTALAGLQKAVSDDWGVGLSYSDQTWVGPAKNMLLNRSLILNANYTYF